MPPRRLAEAFDVTLYPGGIVVISFTGPTTLHDGPERAVDAVTTGYLPGPGPDGRSPSIIDAGRLVRKPTPVPQIRTDLISEAPAGVCAGGRYEQLRRTQFDQPTAVVTVR